MAEAFERLAVSVEVEEWGLGRETGGGGGYYLTGSFRGARTWARLGGSG